MQFPFTQQHFELLWLCEFVYVYRENSVGPFFVGILGQKYGFRPIPYTLPESIFYTIMSYITKQSEQDPHMREAKRLLEQWFKVDWNAIGKLQNCHFYNQWWFFGGYITFSNWGGGHRFESTNDSWIYKFIKHSHIFQYELEHDFPGYMQRMFPTIKSIDSMMQLKFLEWV